MKRGQVYFDHYKDRNGVGKRIPVIIVSNNEYNSTSDFVTVVRLVRRVLGQEKRGTQVFIPGAAFTETNTLSDAYAVCEAITTVRKSNLEGPIGVLASDYYMGEIVDAIQCQVGALPMRPVERRNETPSNVILGRPTAAVPWYSADLEKKTVRPTMPVRPMYDNNDSITKMYGQMGDIQ